MSRFALLSTVGLVSLLAVSFGVAQQSLSTPIAPSNPPVPVPAAPGHPPVVFPNPHAFPPGVQFPATQPAPLGPIAAVPYVSAPAEKMTVKVYSVPDLVAALESSYIAPRPLAASPELAQVVQQVQLQVQAAMPIEPAAEVSKKLERLKKALRVAAPKNSWAENGGEGEIEVYPEAHCLIVRQTSSGHESIADLLSQLRATQDLQIELTVEILTLEGISDELATEAMRLLNRELSPEELAQFRKCGGTTAMSSVVRMTNGRSAAAGLSPEMPLQFTAIASADRRTVEFRTDLPFPIEAERAAMFQACSQSRSVAVGKTIAFLTGGEDPVIMLVSPKIIDRSPEAAKERQGTASSPGT